jgi:hypothetical protein
LPPGQFLIIEKGQRPRLTDNPGSSIDSAAGVPQAFGGRGKARSA